MPEALSGCPTPASLVVMLTLLMATVACRIAHAIVSEYGIAGGLVACAVGYGASLIRPLRIRSFVNALLKSFGLEPP
jgi:hypothetical protein